jgi:hypothetical protein
VTAEQAE